MKNLLLLLSICLLPQLLVAQNQSAIDGTWDGSIILQGQPLLISLTFNTMDGATDGSINIPQQNAFNLPVEVPVLTADSIQFQFETGTGTAVFRASLRSENPDSISGIFTQSGVELPFEMARSMAENDESSDYFTEENISITVDSLTIAGTLVLPDTLQSESLVVLISGSGSQTRNSLVAGFGVFEEMAEQLAIQGISTFRYDDRGTGQSTGSPDVPLDDLAGDLTGITNYFSGPSASSQTQFDQIIYMGHSQGGLVSLLAADSTSPQGIILMATPMLPGDQIITQQIRKISDAQNIPDEILNRNLEFQEAVFEAARTGEGWSELEADLEERLREQLNQLPEEQRSTLGNMDQFIASQVSRQLDGAKSPWFRSFIETDPRPYLRETNVPILALFGENDSQVLLEPNRTALEEIDGSFQIVTIPAANHLFQVSESGMPGEYGVLDKEFAPGLVDQITAFVTGLNQTNE